MDPHSHDTEILQMRQALAGTNKSRLDELEGKQKESKQEDAEESLPPQPHSFHWSNLRPRARWRLNGSNRKAFCERRWSLFRTSTWSYGSD